MSNRTRVLVLYQAQFQVFISIKSLNPLNKPLRQVLSSLSHMGRNWETKTIIKLPRVTQPITGNWSLKSLAEKSLLQKVGVKRVDQPGGDTEAGHLWHSHGPQRIKDQPKITLARGKIKFCFSLLHSINVSVCVDGWVCYVYTFVWVCFCVCVYLNVSICACMCCMCENVFLCGFVYVFVSVCVRERDRRERDGNKYNKYLETAFGQQMSKGS
jgi:hypothetical protein